MGRPEAYEGSVSASRRIKDNKHDEISWKWLRRSLVGFAVLVGLLSSGHSKVDAPLVAAGWTCTVFALVLFPVGVHPRETWFWKALCIAVGAHVVILAALLRFFVHRNFILLFFPMLLEYIVFVILFLQFDPRHGE
jgi:hypothetical protein